MVTKKIRTEYMKKFRDPRWETFSRCYEDSLRYRLSRRLMEHSHKPWFWDGVWDGGSDSSGWSTPRPSRNRIAPLSLPPPPEGNPGSPGPGPEPGPGSGPEPAREPRPGPATSDGEAEAPAVLGNAVTEASGGETETDNGPVDTSSDGEPVNPAPRRRHRRRAPRSEPGHRDGSHEDKPAAAAAAAAAARKPPRAKSQPAISTKENRRPSSRLDWTERQTEARRTPNQSNTSDACVQTRRESSKRVSDPDRRRARSADLEKLRRSQLTVADDHWMTEYMRCFSARLR